MAKALLFDLDGTILDPNGSIRSTIDQVLRERGYKPFDPETRRLIGKPLRDILRLRTDDEDTLESMVVRYREAFHEEAWRMVRFFDGMQPLLLHLAARVPLAVVTTKGESEARLLLQKLGVDHCFAAIVGDDDRRPVKPHPAPVVHACDELGILPADAVMVGDTPYDVEAARKAGATPIGVLWGHGTEERLRTAGAEAVAHNTDELRTLLLAHIEQ